MFITGVLDLRKVKVREGSSPVVTIREMPGLKARMFWSERGNGNQVPITFGKA